MISQRSYERVSGELFSISIISFESIIGNYSNSAKDQSSLHLFRKKILSITGNISYRQKLNLLHKNDWKCNDLEDRENYRSYYSRYRRILIFRISYQYWYMFRFLWIPLWRLYYHVEVFCRFASYSVLYRSLYYFRIDFVSDSYLP